MSTAATRHHIEVLVPPGVLALDYGIPVQAFGAWEDGPYRLTVCTQFPGAVPVEAGPSLLITRGLAALADADTVIVPGHARLDPPPAEVLAALVQAAERGARMVSICTGAFVLAAAGLLDGRRATTH